MRALREILMLFIKNAYVAWERRLGRSIRSGKLHGLSSSQMTNPKCGAVSSQDLVDGFEILFETKCSKSVKFMTKS